MPDARPEVDQLGFWAAHQEQFPLLSYLVRVIFPVPAASSKSERVFSEAGNIVTPKRNSLSPKQVEKKIVVLLILIISSMLFLISFLKVENLVVVKCNAELLRTMKN